MLAILYLVGPDLLVLSPPFFYWILLGNLVGPYFVLTLLVLFTAYFTLQERPFYLDYLLCIAFALKRTRGPTLGLILYFQWELVLFGPFLGPHLFGSLPLWALELGPIFFSLLPL